MLKDLYLTYWLVLEIYKNKKKLNDDPFNNSEISYHIMSTATTKGGYVIKVNGYENLPDEMGVIFISNHQSILDILASIVVLRRQLSFIGKVQLRRLVSIGTYIEAMDGILIERDNIKSQVRLIKDLTAKLKDGKNVFVFPEGTRSKTGELLEFKSGTFKMATKSKAMIVPITFYDNYKLFGKKANVIKMKIDKPITFEEYGHLSTQEIATMARSVIAKNLEEGFDMENAETIT